MDVLSKTEHVAAMDYCQLAGDIRSQLAAAEQRETALHERLQSALAEVAELSSSPQGPSRDDLGLAGTVQLQAERISALEHEIAALTSANAAGSSSVAELESQILEQEAIFLAKIQAAGERGAEAELREAEATKTLNETQGNFEALAAVHEALQNEFSTRRQSTPQPQPDHLVALEKRIAELETDLQQSRADTLIADRNASEARAAAAAMEQSLKLEQQRSLPGEHAPRLQQQDNVLQVAEMVAELSRKRGEAEGTLEKTRHELEQARLDLRTSRQAANTAQEMLEAAVSARSLAESKCASAENALAESRAAARRNDEARRIAEEDAAAAWAQARAAVTQLRQLESSSIDRELEMSSLSFAAAMDRSSGSPRHAFAARVEPTQISEMASELQRTQRELGSCKDQLAANAAALDDARKRLAEAEAATRSAHTVAASQEQAAVSARVKLEEAAARLAALELRCNAAEQKVTVSGSDGPEELVASPRSSAELQVELREWQSLAKRADTSLNASRAELNDVRQQLAAAERRSERAQKFQAEAERRQAAAEAELASVVAATSDSIDDLEQAEKEAELQRSLKEAARLKAQLAERTTRLQSAEVEITRLQDDLATKGQALDILESTVSDSDSDDEFAAENTKLSEQAAVLTAKVAALEATVRQATADANSSRQAAEAARTEADMLRSTSVVSRRMVQTQMAAKAAAEQAQLEAQAAAKASKDQVNTLKERQAAAEGALAERTAELEQQRAELARVLAEHEQTKAELAQLLAEHGAARTEATAGSAKLTELQRQLEAAEAATAVAEASLKSSQVEADQLREEISLVTAAAEARARSKMEELEQRVRQAEAARRALAQQLKELGGGVRSQPVPSHQVDKRQLLQQLQAEQHHQQQWRLHTTASASGYSEPPRAQRQTPALALSPAPYTSDGGAAARSQSHVLQAGRIGGATEPPSLSMSPAGAWGTSAIGRVYSYSSAGAAGANLSTVGPETPSPRDTEQSAALESVLTRINARMVRERREAAAAAAAGQGGADRSARSPSPSSRGGSDAPPPTPPAANLRSVRASGAQPVSTASRGLAFFQPGERDRERQRETEVGRNLFPPRHEPPRPSTVSFSSSSHADASARSGGARAQQTTAGSSAAAVPSFGAPTNRTSSNSSRSFLAAFEDRSG